MLCAFPSACGLGTRHSVLHRDGSDSIVAHSLGLTRLCQLSPSQPAPHALASSAVATFPYFTSPPRSPVTVDSVSTVYVELLSYRDLHTLFLYSVGYAVSTHMFSKSSEFRADIRCQCVTPRDCRLRNKYVFRPSSLVGPPRRCSCRPNDPPRSPSTVCVRSAHLRPARRVLLIRRPFTSNAHAKAPTPSSPTWPEGLQHLT